MSYRKDLKKFKKFLKKYKFTPYEITSKGKKLLCNDEVIFDGKDYISETDNWINVGYSNKGAFPKLLSNLYPYEFTYKGIKFASIEGFFQGIKFKDVELQRKAFLYSGKEACILKEASNYDWTKTGIIYFNGKEIDRFSSEYDKLVLEIYISAIQNPFYRGILKNTKKYIIHAIGKENTKETVFTRYEFEYMLNALRKYIQKIDK